MILKTTHHILNNPWEDKNPSMFSSPSPTLKWHKKENPTIDDIDLWEELYYEKGNVGIYGAYSPHSELYIIVYNLFVEEACGIKIYSGNNAALDVSKKASELGIMLPLYQIKIKE